VCDLGAIGAPSIFKVIRKAAAFASRRPTFDLSCEENTARRYWNSVSPLPTSHSRWGAALYSNIAVSSRAVSSAYNSLKTVLFRLSSPHLQASSNLSHLSIEYFQVYQGATDRDLIETCLLRLPARDLPARDLPDQPACDLTEICLLRLPDGDLPARDLPDQTSLRPDRDLPAQAAVFAERGKGDD
jgi:hypothetical protein